MDSPASSTGDSNNTPSSNTSFFPDELAELLPSGKDGEEAKKNMSVSSATMQTTGDGLTKEDEKKDEEPSSCSNPFPVDTVYATAEYLAASVPFVANTADRATENASFNTDADKKNSSMGATTKPNNSHATHVIEELALTTSSVNLGRGYQEKGLADAPLIRENDDGSPLLLIEKWNEAVARPLQRSMDEHVKPQFDKLGEAVDEHIKPKFNEFGKAVDEHIKPHFNNLGQAVDEHVKPQFDTVGRSLLTFHDQTSQAMKQLSDDTKLKTQSTLNALGNSSRSLFEDHVNPHVTKIQRTAKLGLDRTTLQTQIAMTSTRNVLLTEIPHRTQKVVNQHVLPTVNMIQAGAHEKLNLAATKSLKSYQKNVKPHVDQIQEKHNIYAKYYMNTAPGVFHDAPLSDTKPLTECNGNTQLLIAAESFLMSFGRVYFCQSPISGLSLLLGLFISSPMAALAASTCVVSTIVTSHYWFNLIDDEAVETLNEKQENSSGNAHSVPTSISARSRQKQLLRSGNLCFNAVVVGAGCSSMISFQNLILGDIGLLMMCFVLGPVTLITYLVMDSKNNGPHSEAGTTTPPLLLPSNVILGVVCVSAVLWDRALLETPAAMAAIATSDEEITIEYSVLAATLNGISSIVFIPAVTATGTCTASTFSGAVLLFGIFLCSRIVAGALLVGSFGGCVCGIIFDAHPVLVNSGLAGGSTALTCAALVYYYELPPFFFRPRSVAQNFPSVIRIAFVLLLAIAGTGLMEAAIGAVMWELL